MRHRDEAASQWRMIVQCDWPREGGRQANFAPVEVVASLALITVVDPSSQGGSDWSQYHPELQRLSRLCKRSPGSFAEKERNLLGQRPHAGRGERELFLAVVEEPMIMSGRERWDPRNGIAACPTHDAAFDGGLLTVTQDGRIHPARALREAAARDPSTAASLSASLRPRHGPDGTNGEGGSQI